MYVYEEMNTYVFSGSEFSGLKVSVVRMYLANRWLLITSVFFRGGEL